jgi:hypothetical protein
MPMRWSPSVLRLRSPLQAYGSAEILGHHLRPKVQDQGSSRPRAGGIQAHHGDLQRELGRQQAQGLAFRASISDVVTDATW